MQLTDSIKTIKGIGEKTALLFQKLEIYSIKDLLHYFPRDYEQVNDVAPISSLKEKDTVIIQGTVIQIKPLKKVRNLMILNVLVRDKTGAMNIILEEIY